MIRFRIAPGLGSLVILLKMHSVHTKLQEQWAFSGIRSFNRWHVPATLTPWEPQTQEAPYRHLAHLHGSAVRTPRDGDSRVEPKALPRSSGRSGRDRRLFRVGFLALVWPRWASSPSSPPSPVCRLCYHHHPLEQLAYVQVLKNLGRGHHLRRGR